MGITIAMQRPRPTKISPSRSPGLSGRKAQDRPNYHKEISKLYGCLAWSE